MMSMSSRINSVKNKVKTKRNTGEIAGRKKVVLRTAGLLAAMTTAGMLTFFGIVQYGWKNLNKQGAYLETLAEELPDPEWTVWNGNMYEYREGLVNILFLGIDGRGKAEENTAVGFGPRADCIILVTLDIKQNTLTLLNISRDSVTPIRWFDSNGMEVGLYDYQLGLQYTLGDGLEGSCQLMEEAVSRMLGGIPIHGYCALYWEGVEMIQEETGPVTVLVPEELHELDPYHFLEYGEMELTPEQAKIFVQGRDIEQTGSNELRILRQQEYIKALYEKLKKKLIRNPFSVFALKDAVKEYLVTDLEMEELLSLSWKARGALNEDLHLLSVPGITEETEFQDEFHINQAAMDELMISLFYQRVGQE